MAVGPKGGDRGLSKGWTRWKSPPLPPPAKTFATRLPDMGSPASELAVLQYITIVSYPRGSPMLAFPQKGTVILAKVGLAWRWVEIHLMHPPKEEGGASPMGPKHEEEAGQKRHLIEPERKKRKGRSLSLLLLFLSLLVMLCCTFFGKDTFLLFRRVSPVGNRMHIFSPSGLSPGRRKRKNAPYFSFRFAKKGGGGSVCGDGIYPPFPSRKKPSPPLPFSPPGDLWCRILVSDEEGGGWKEGRLHLRFQSRGRKKNL